MKEGRRRRRREKIKEAEEGRGKEEGRGGGERRKEGGEERGVDANFFFIPRKKNLAVYGMFCQCACNKPIIGAEAVLVWERVSDVLVTKSRQYSLTTL